MQDSKSKDVEHIVILSGDHLYRMDYMSFVQVSLYLYLVLLNSHPLHKLFGKVSNSLSCILPEAH